MLILRALIDSGSSYYAGMIKKLKEARGRGLLYVDVIKKKHTMYIIGFDDGFSAAFLYQAYLKAKKKGLKVSLFYAKWIEPNDLPEDVKRLGEKWVSEKLNEEEVTHLKNISITEYMLSRR